MKYFLSVLFTFISLIGFSQETEENQRLSAVVINAQTEEVFMLSTLIKFLVLLPMKKVSFQLPQL